jgi:hypothetical protein
MRKSFAAFAFAIFSLAQPASAITFSKLTTIYIGSGVYDDGSDDGSGEATSIHCSNVSGVAVQVRALVLSFSGSVEGSLTTDLAHGATFTFSTHNVFIFADSTGVLNTGQVTQGVVNVEATNSAVFCTAVVVDAAGKPPVFMSPLHLVRVNAHPGTVE